MTKDKIEITASRLRFEEIYARNNPKRKFNRSPDGYHQPHAHLCYYYWLAAKQDAADQEKEFLAEMTKAIEQSSDGNSFCTYCGSGNQDHLPNCKGDSRG